jgi:hypothetical protein
MGVRKICVKFNLNEYVDCSKTGLWAAILKMTRNGSHIGSIVNEKIRNHILCWLWLRTQSRVCG